MPEYTPFLDLYLPGGGSSGLITPDEVVDIDKINDNMRKIDTFASGAGAAPVSLAVALDTSNFTNQAIPLTTTKSADKTVVLHGRISSTKTLSVATSIQVGTIDPSHAADTTYHASAGSNGASNTTGPQFDVIVAGNTVSLICLGSSWTTANWIFINLTYFSSV